MSGVLLNPTLQADSAANQLHSLSLNQTQSSVSLNQVPIRFLSYANTENKTKLNKLMKKLLAKIEQESDDFDAVYEWVSAIAYTYGANQHLQMDLMVVNQGEEIESQVIIEDWQKNKLQTKNQLYQFLDAKLDF
ncbi:hypothetical protein [Paraferrimonas haliotis]|uniref:Uncharacterized protein n=1 Tax=Paraferrimonas haliotis TaxID=2013866 RepID=A0AA37TJA9_9GAMM|nr:hypothetical protein [Paraferrimonas haliotis]GLS82567.1 hypothetical protein GCM10007894_05440 [Paraferrimonas haliotis]